MESKIAILFINNVRSIIKKNNFTTASIAEKAGVSQGGLSDLLKPRTKEQFKDARCPTLDYANRIARALGYPLGALLSDMDYPNEEFPLEPDLRYVSLVLPKGKAMMATGWHVEFKDEVDKLVSESHHKKYQK